MTGLDPFTIQDMVDYAPTLPFGDLIGFDLVQAFDPTDEGNLLIVGGAGTGKTNATNMLAAAAFVQDSLIYCIRPVMGEDLLFDERADGLEDAAELLRSVHVEQRERERDLRKAGAPTIEQLPADHRPPRLFVIVDGLLGLTLRTAAPDGTDEAARASEYFDYLAVTLDALARSGRDTNIHIIYTALPEDGVLIGLQQNAAVLTLEAGEHDMDISRGSYDLRFGYDASIKMWSAPAAEQILDTLGD